MPGHMAAKRLAGVAPEVNLLEYVTHTPLPCANKAAHSGFETRRRRQQKSNTEVSVAQQKEHVSNNNFKKTTEFTLLNLINLGRILLRW